MSQVITFEDHGQDFLWWTVKDGVVTECGPFQDWLWIGTRIHNKRIRKGDTLEITPKSGGLLTLNYPVASVKTSRA